MKYLILILLIISCEKPPIVQDVPFTAEDCMNLCLPLKVKRFSPGFVYYTNNSIHTHGSYVYPMNKACECI